MLDQRSRVCPHLGLTQDRATHMAFPSVDNICFNSKPTSSPSLSHQQEFCLEGSYRTCVIYQEQRTRPMPSQIRAERSVFGISSKTVIVFVVLLIVGVGVWLVGNYWKDFRDSLFAGPEPTIELAIAPMFTSLPETTTSVPTLLAAPLFTETVTPALVAVDASSPKPGETMTPLPSAHRFEVTKMPPGSYQGYLVHIVAVGETLDKIAENYSTTVPAIMAVNYELKPPVWVQYPLVIPLGAKDATGLPAFKVYVVEAYESISAPALANVLGVDADEFAFYNLCTSNCQFQKGDVLLVPYIEIE